MSTDKLRPIVNLVALLGVLAINFLAEAIPLNDLTSAQIANRYPDLLYFPANYAFSIWSVIYAFLIAFGIYQVLPAQRDNPHLQRIGWLFVVSCIFNAAWLISFHYLQFAFSMVMMVGLLATLITIYLRLRIGIEPVSRATKWLIHVPFSIYLGWITAATITNAAYVSRMQGGAVSALTLRRGRSSCLRSPASLRVTSFIRGVMSPTAWSSFGR